MRIGIPAVYATWPAFLITWLLYHLYLWINYCRTGRKEGESYFAKKKSMYYVEAAIDEGKKGEEEKNGKKEIGTIVPI